jgi:hypothetical protein
MFPIQFCARLPNASTLISIFPKSFTDKGGTLIYSFGGDREGSPSASRDLF